VCRTQGCGPQRHIAAPHYSRIRLLIVFQAAAFAGGGVDTSNVVEGEDGDGKAAAKAKAAAAARVVVVPFLRADVDLMAEFVSRWTALVPRLRDLKAAAAEARKAEARRARKEAEAFQKRAATAGGAAGDEEEEDEDGEEEDEEHVEQEGCPDENDFNKWSHHRSVQSCDDDVLRQVRAGSPMPPLTVLAICLIAVRWHVVGGFGVACQALGDDDVVTFVFGLEVRAHGAVEWCDSPG